MLYTTQLTVQPSTLVTNPSSVTIPMTLGKINQITVMFPPGCCALVGVWLEHHTVKVLPWSMNEFLIGAGATMTFPMNYGIDTEPYTVILYAYNNDDVYPHTVYVTINLSDETPIEPVAVFAEL